MLSDAPPSQSGGNKGIGAAIVESCLQQGAHVVLAARSLERAKETAAALVAANPSFDGRLDVVALDVTVRSLPTATPLFTIYHTAE